MKLTTGMRLAQYGFTAIALSAFGYCALEWSSEWLYQTSEARRFDHELGIKSPPALPDPLPRAAWFPAAGGLVGRLEIPRIGVSVMVVEGTGGQELARAAGHIRGTSLPGEPGNVGIAAHRDTFFRPLAGIHTGDVITMATLQGTYRYRVSATQVVMPEDVSVLSWTERDSLTLITCYPFHYAGAAPRRFIVRAVRLPAAG